MMTPEDLFPNRTKMLKINYLCEQFLDNANLTSRLMQDNLAVEFLAKIREVIDSA